MVALLKVRNFSARDTRAVNVANMLNRALSTKAPDSLDRDSRSAAAVYHISEPF
jgi:hypothetical protein